MTPYIQQQLKSYAIIQIGMTICSSYGIKTQEIKGKLSERFPNPGSNKNDYTLYLSDPQAQYNKLLRTQQKLRNKKK